MGKNEYVDIAFSSLENRESAFFVFSEKAISEVKDMYCQGRQIYIPFCFTLIQRGPSYYPKEKNYSHGTRIQETKKSQKSASKPWLIQRTHLEPQLQKATQQK